MKSNIKISQRFKNKVTLITVNASLYILNNIINDLLKVETVVDEIRRFAMNHVKQLELYKIIEVIK